MEIAGATWFARFRKSVNSVSSWVEWVGLVSMVAILLIAVVDVVGSKFFQWPVPGSTEITGLAGLVAIAAGLAFSKIDGGQICVDVFINVLPRRGKAALGVFNSILGLGFFVVVGWMTYAYGLSLEGTTTNLLSIAYWPFAFWISFCCIPMCFVIVIELLNSLDKVVK